MKCNHLIGTFTKNWHDTVKLSAEISTINFVTLRLPRSGTPSPTRMHQNVSLYKTSKFFGGRRLDAERMGYGRVSDPPLTSITSSAPRAPRYSRLRLSTWGGSVSHTYTRVRRHWWQCDTGSTAAALTLKVVLWCCTVYQTYGRNVMHH